MDNGDWQAGDLALCVAITHPRFKGRSAILRIGAIYTVAEPFWSEAMDMAGLVLVEVSPNLERGFPADCFRKITPLTPEEHRQAIAELARPVEVVS